MFKELLEFRLTQFFSLDLNEIEDQGLFCLIFVLEEKHWKIDILNRSYETMAHAAWFILLGFSQKQKTN